MTVPSGFLDVLALVPAIKGYVGVLFVLLLSVWLARNTVESARARNQAEFNVQLYVKGGGPRHRGKLLLC